MTDARPRVKRRRGETLSESFFFFLKGPLLHWHIVEETLSKRVERYISPPPHTADSFLLPPSALYNWDIDLYIELFFFFFFHHVEESDHHHSRKPLFFSFSFFSL
jgi:hypothetical protein